MSQCRDFCGINYEDSKSIVELTCTLEAGVNIREGISLNTPVTGRIEHGQSRVFCGETFREGGNSIRVQMKDGSGYTTIFDATGGALMGTPTMPALQSSTDASIIHFVTVHARSYRFLSAYRTALHPMNLFTCLR